jgi:hypothetical protein
MPNAVYTYTGNDFQAAGGGGGYNTTSDVVTVSLAFSTPLLPNTTYIDPGPAQGLTSFTASDGVNTITGNTLTGSDYLFLQTDGSGQITQWGMELFNANGLIQTVNTPSHSSITFPDPVDTILTPQPTDQGGNQPSTYGYNYGVPGHWNTTVAVDPTVTNVNQTLDGSAGNVVLDATNAPKNTTTTLIGGPGDTLIGTLDSHGKPAGGDIFVFHGNFGQNTITNYAAGDKIQFDSSAFGSNPAAILSDAHQVGADTVITDPHNSANTVTLTDVQLSSLQHSFNSGHFLLV